MADFFLGATGGLYALSFTASLRSAVKGYRCHPWRDLVSQGDSGLESCSPSFALPQMQFTEHRLQILAR